MNDKDKAVKVGRRYYCPPCAEERGSNTESDWDILFNYICWLYGIPRPTGQMFKQLKDFRENWGYSDSEIWYTLRYYHEVLEKPVKDDAGLGIVPYYYDRALAHWWKKCEIDRICQEYTQNEETRYVKVTQPERWKPKQPLDFSTVDWGDKHED